MHTPFGSQTLQFDLQALCSPWLIAPPALTAGIIGTLSTVGKQLGDSDGLTFCNPPAITVLTGDKKRGTGGLRLDQAKITQCAVGSSGRSDGKFREHRHRLLLPAKVLKIMTYAPAEEAIALVENKSNK